MKIFIFIILYFNLKKINAFEISKANLTINTIYNIFSLSRNKYVSIKNNNILLSIYQSNFVFIQIEINKYYIEYRFNKKRLGINTNGNLKLYKKNNKKYKKNMVWIIIRLNNKGYLIKNNYTNNYIYANEINLICSKKINKNENINNNFLFYFYELCVEDKLKNKYLNIIKNEPIDALIKYIDLTDKTLNRTGIKQIYKDKDNEELKYSIRSVLNYIPWIRKIFILMPNEFVRFFKPKELIEEKIIYINDKDFLGFDSANIFSFTFNLFKLKRFGVSENFIYLEDDFFFGKYLNKYDFFYYNNREKKIIPYLITNYFYELNRSEILFNYNNLFINKDSFHPHSLYGWWMSIYGTDKYFMQQYNNKTIIKTRFTHNAKPENIGELKEMYEYIQNYEYINETLFSKERHIFTLNQPHFENLFQLNIKHKKIHSIPYQYVEIENIKKHKLLTHLFVINTSGNHIPLNRQLKIQQKVMEKRFPFGNRYEIKNHILTKKNKLIDFFIILIKLFTIIIIYKLIKILFLLTHFNNIL